MSFDDRDVRRGMDVFTLDNVLVGTVVWIRGGRPRQSRTGRAPEAGGQTSDVSGETLGPMPTTRVGNRGPLTQGAGTRFASRAERVGRALDGAELLVLRTPIGPDLRRYRPRLRSVPLTAVQTVSLERVVLRVTEADLEAART